MSVNKRVSREPARMAGAFVAMVVASVAFTATASMSALAQSSSAPPSFEQILPRGRIAAVDDPVFVPAAEAKVLPESWVLGVLIEGQPRAFSLAVLNSHEIVNDSIGDTNYAAVW